jgi:hypothetical protein
MRWLVLVVVVLAGCGGSKSTKAPPGQLMSAMVHADPVAYVDGGALPAGAIERRILTCNGQAAELPADGVLTAEAFRVAFPGSGLKRCTSRVLVAGVASGPSNEVRVNCVQNLCFRVPGG